MKPAVSVILVLSSVVCGAYVYLNFASISRPSDAVLAGRSQGAGAPDLDRARGVLEDGPPAGEGTAKVTGDRQTGRLEIEEGSISSQLQSASLAQASGGALGERGVPSQTGAPGASVGDSAVVRNAVLFELSKVEPEPTKILAVIDGDGSNFVLPAELIGFAGATNVTKNEMALRNPLVDEQTKINALAQLTGAYSEKAKEASLMQAIARDLTQPESVRVGAFLKLADLGESYISSFAQTSDKAIKLEFEMLQMMRKHQVQEGLPDGILRAAVP